MYNKKSVLEYRTENDAYLVAKDRNRQIYMAESGGDFLVFQSSDQSTEIIDTTDIDAVGRMRDELLMIASDYTSYPFDVELDVGYLNLFKEEQLNGDLNEEEEILYEVLLTNSEDKKLSEDVFIDIDGVEKLQSLLHNEELDKPISIGVAILNSHNDLSLLNMSYDHLKLVELSSTHTDLGFFTSLKRCSNIEDSISNQEDINFSSYVSLEGLLNYEKGLSQLEISKEGLQALDSGSWQSVHFLASTDNWKENLSEYQRTFQTNSEEKIFDSSMGGYSMFSMPTDVKTWFGSSRQVPIRMEDAKIDKFYFTGDDIKGLKFAGVINHIKKHENKVQIKSSIKM